MTSGEEKIQPEDIELYYPNVDAFLHDFLLPSWRHTYSGTKWCRDWYKHSEAVSRLDALWRSYEAMRVGDPTGMAVWWRDFADPTMASLTRPEGTFAGCNPETGQHQPLKIWPAKHAPEVTVRPETVLRPRSKAQYADEL